jgi:hypothetical protein
MKTCRSRAIFVGDDGACRVKKEGPHGNKAEIEGYVDLRECRCSRCNYWELDERTQIGQCGAREDLFFFMARRDAEQGESSPVCNNFRKQIDQPGFTARLD